MRKIIILEDDHAVMDVLQLILTPEFSVTGFSDATALLEDQFEIPDLFLIDKQLPGIDGLDLCRHLKSQEHTKNIPTIIISASPYVRNHAFKSGADDFIEKPFSTSDLIRAVRNQFPD